MSIARILVLCTGNSCRSLMAESWLKRLLGDKARVESAGVRAKGPDPKALQVLEEAGFSTGELKSTAIAELEQQSFDLVLTVCDNARESCPVFPGSPRSLHQAFDDPPALTAGMPDKEALDVYRRVRDEIGEFCKTLSQSREMVYLLGIADTTQDPDALAADELRDRVRQAYAGALAKTLGGSCCSDGPALSSCCGNSQPADASLAMGYSQEDLAGMDDANLGFGCGNPQAIAELKPGEVVLDLGSGAGFDCFLAARQVGDSGRVIGVDMTPDMISRARQTAREGGWNNTEFRLGEIEHIPAADNSVDVIMSNCVINLSPDKAAVFREAWRVLKPGGRLAISDIVALNALPQTLKENLDAWCGCVSGATQMDELGELMEAAGFQDVLILPRAESREMISQWFPGSGAEGHVVSAIIKAWKAT